MKALVWEAARSMMMREKPQPEAIAGEVVIRVAHVGICGSELSGFLGLNALRVPPLIMGHEFAGEIVEVGAGVEHLKVGQFATANPLDYCGECEFCQIGLNQLCSKRQLVGAHRPGAFAGYVSVPAKLVTTLPDGMDTRIGALTEPVACAVRIGEHAGNIQGADCLVIGAGPIGLLAMQVFKLNGANRVFVAELDTQRLAMVEALGAICINPHEVDTIKYVRENTNNRGVAVAVDAVGTALTRDQCAKSLRPTGMLILSGLHEETSAMHISDLIRREITVKGSFSYSPQNFADALKLLVEKKIGLSPWIIEAPLEEGQQWFERLIDEPGAVSKVLLVP
jgi:2-desacetyl-2-hydroxyethyl bacteriochlorophyllide A dehydrogenase